MQETHFSQPGSVTVLQNFVKTLLLDLFKKTWNQAYNLTFQHNKNSRSYMTSIGIRMQDYQKFRRRKLRRQKFRRR